MLNQYSEIIPTRWGNMVALKCDSHITGSLAMYGESTIDEVNACLELVKPGNTFVDVGANIGTFTVPMALAVGRSGSVISFEPQRIAYQCLCANLVINSLSDYVDPIRAAVGAVDDVASVPVINPFQKDNNVGGVRINTPCDASEQVPLVTLDSANLQACDLIKIDVEGMEHLVLKGAANTVSKFKPAIFAECLPGDAQNKAGILAFLAEQNYEGRYFGTPLFSPRNSRLCKENIFGEQANFNVIAIHREKQSPDWFKTIQEFK